MATEVNSINEVQSIKDYAIDPAKLTGYEALKKHLFWTNR